MITKSSTGRWFHWFPVLIVLALGAIVYYPGLFGDFVFDDAPNITENQRLLVDELSITAIRQAAFSGDAGMLKRPVSMLSFWANYSTSGLDPFFFKLTNVVIHLLAGLTVFVLSKHLVASPVSLRKHSNFTSSTNTSIALVAMAVWLVHPLNLTSVLYVVQRMTSLAGLFVLLALLCYLIGRRRLIEGSNTFPPIFAGVLGFGTLAIFSKENGILLPFYLATIELTLYRFEARDARARGLLKIIVLSITVGPLLLAAGYMLVHPEWLPSQYTGRHFGPAERLLTEARVLWLYLWWTLMPTPAALGLYHDDIEVSEGLFDPITTLVSVAGILAALAGAIALRNKAPLVAFGVLWFFVGHSLESSFIGLELVHEHRNYLPVFGPLLAAVVTVRASLGILAPRLRIGIAVASVLAFSSVTVNRAIDWSDGERLALALVRHHPDSARSNHEAGMTLGAAALRNPNLAPGYYEQTKTYFQLASALDKTSVNSLFSLILLEASVGKVVDEHTLQELKTRLEQAPSQFTFVGAFRSLVGWITEGAVMLPDKEVLALFEAALNNETLSPRTQAGLLSLLSAYHYNVLGNTQEAVGLALAAVEAAPNLPTHRISLATLAIELGNYELGANALAEASQRDPFGQHALEIKQLGSFIASKYAVQ